MTAVYLAVHLEIVHNKMCLITSHKTVANIYRHKALALLPQYLLDTSLHLIEKSFDIKHKIRLGNMQVVSRLFPLLSR